MKPILAATLGLMLACVAGYSQEKSNRELAGINGPVRTVRIENRQLHALKYRQWGVMVYTTIYDAKGRVLEDAEYLPGGNPDTKYTSTYDERGNEIEHAHYTHDGLTNRSTTRYDGRNRKIEELTFDSGGKQTSKIAFQYDQRGKQTWFGVEPGGTRRRRGSTIFDERGHPLERVEYDERGAVNHRYLYSYDAAGNKTSEVDSYKDDGRTRTSKHSYVYDHDGDLIEEAYYSDDVLQRKEVAQRDRRGNKVEGSETDGKGVVKERWKCSYDEFDSDGNWTRAVMSAWSDRAPNEPLQPTSELRRVFGKPGDATIALWSAAREGDVERFTALLRQGADVNASHPDGSTPLIKAVDRGHRDLVQALLAAGAKVDGRDAEGWTALMWSAERGRLEIVNQLLGAGADPNARNEAGGVAIMPASLNGHIEVLKVLVQRGVDVNAAADDGSTALMVAAREGQTEAVRFLLAHGADAKRKTAGDVTTIFFAVTGGKIETINVLIEAGVDLNARAKGGVTPLMVAAERSERAAIQLLIDKGADINAKSDDGRTALGIATTARHQEAVELLRKSGAK